MSTRRPRPTVAVTRALGTVRCGERRVPDAHTGGRDDIGTRRRLAALLSVDWADDTVHRDTLDAALLGVPGQPHTAATAVADYLTALHRRGSVVMGHRFVHVAEPARLRRAALLELDPAPRWCDFIDLADLARVVRAQAERESSTQVRARRLAEADHLANIDPFAVVELLAGDAV
jgi:hypothetical protein